MSFEVGFAPSRLRCGADASTDLLTAARAAGIAVRQACRNGVCEICEAQLLSGAVRNTRNGDAQCAPATVLLCRALALSDCLFQIEGLMGPGELPNQTLAFRVGGIEPLNHDVYRVRLMAPPGRRPAFHAGQYLSVNLPGLEPAWFSIASAPDAPDIELHIQASPDWTSAQRVIEHLRDQPSVQVSLPFGKACLASVPPQPLVLVVAGTGFAQAKSVLDYVLAQPACGPVTLYWGVRRAQDMYLADLPRQWVRQYPAFRFVPVMGDSEDNDWPGHHDQLVAAVRAGGHDWTATQVLASGSPGMVYTLLDALTADGLPSAAFLSDVLEYAPR